MPYMKNAEGMPLYYLYRIRAGYDPILLGDRLTAGQCKARITLDELRLKMAGRAAGVKWSKERMDY
jgi:hypothetical protein